MRRVLAATASLSLLSTTACVSTDQVADAQFAPPTGSYSLLVMRPDVSVGSVTMGGIVEPRADWTEQARANLLAALRDQQAGQGGRTTILENRAGLSGVDAEQVADLERLFAAVGSQIVLSEYAGQELPTKRRQGLDWTLGEEAVKLGRATGHDYALFLYAEDSFASTGRVALSVIGLAGCFVGFCAPLSGGRQVAYASLVDLRTGDVAWFNVLQSQLGDIRTREGADKMVERLLGRMKAGRDVRRAQRAAS